MSGGGWYVGEIPGLWFKMAMMLSLGSDRIEGKRGRLPARFRAAFLIVPALALAQEADRKVVFEKQTPFQRIVVADDTRTRTRYLFSDTREFIQGAASLDDPERLLLEYNRVSLLGAALHTGRIRSALFAGLGAGSLPGFFHRILPAVRVEAVEIDPDMVEVARTLFGFDPRIPVYVADARTHIRKLRLAHDLLFVDCYIGEEIPRHLATLEFVREARTALRPGGVLVANLQPSVINPLFGSMVETFRAVFPTVYLFTGERSTNVILVATLETRRRDEKALADLARRFEKRTGIDLGLVAASARQLYWTPPVSPPPLLRDPAPEK